jgi:uncharacterized membrane protein
MAALVALVAVFAAGLALRKPLRRVPENAIKYIVGGMITAFGTFWTREALAGDIWRLGDWSLLILALFYLGGGQALVSIIRPTPRHATV